MQDPISILLVDDEPRNLDVLEAILSAPDLRLVRAVSADEALLALLQPSFAAIVLDIKMPGVDGFELAHIIKQRKKTQDIPILFLTAHLLAEEDVLQGYGAGAVDYLTKPIDPQILRSKIGVFVDLYRKTRALAEANRALSDQIAERLKAEEALRVANEELERRVRERTEDLMRTNQILRSVADNTPNILARVAPDLRYVFVNAAAERATGLPQEAFVGKTNAELGVLMDASDRWDEGVRCVFETGEPGMVELSITKPGGEKRVYSVRLVPEHGNGGRVEHVLSVAHDITEQRLHAEERERLLQSERAARGDLERQSRIKDEFLATLSHELRTPLTSVLAWTQMLQRTGVEGKVARGLEVIERNARAQARLVEDLLEMSRIISGKVRLDVQTIDIEDVASAAFASVKPSADAKGVQLSKALCPVPGPVLGDASRLQQVVWNILTNAVKFTPAGGRVSVLVAPVDGRVKIQVQDTGVGIKPEFLPHVFDRFRQADGSTTRRHGGLGLGLSIVRQLVDLHGGAVRADSAGEGAGATFTVELPLAPAIRDEAAHARADVASPQPAAPGELPGVRVLAVDDDPDTREAIQQMLLGFGAQVLTASSADEALAILGRERVDVLLSDIGMPERDGYSLITEVRGREAGRAERLPAIALTAFARPEDRRRTNLAGFDAHVAKPIEPMELIMAIANVTRRPPASAADGAPPSSAGENVPPVTTSSAAPGSPETLA
jgi:PAS domain S-box-containing protein